MSDVLRLQALTLPVGDLDAVDRFYRWALQAKSAADEEVPGARWLGWGREDRLRIVDGGAGSDAPEAVTLRLAARSWEELVTWCAEKELAPVEVRVPPADGGPAESAWPEARIVELEDQAEGNRRILVIRGPVEPRIELFVPIPKEELAPRRAMGPFYWKSADWRGLEVPGLLGVTTGAGEPLVLRDFLGALGIEPMEGDGSPLALGDHQWIVERREPAGIYGFAIVVRDARIPDLVRTLDHLEAEYRHEKNRILTADPAGRLILIHGVVGG